MVNRYLSQPQKPSSRIFSVFTVKPSKPWHVWRRQEVLPDMEYLLSCHETMCVCISVVHIIITAGPGRFLAVLQLTCAETAQAV